jgi:hypothetical protein
MAADCRCWMSRTSRALPARTIDGPSNRNVASALILVPSVRPTSEPTPELERSFSRCAFRIADHGLGILGRGQPSEASQCDARPQCGRLPSFRFVNRPPIHLKTRSRSAASVAAPDRTTTLGHPPLQRKSKARSVLAHSHVVFYLLSVVRNLRLHFWAQRNHQLCIMRICIPRLGSARLGGAAEDLPLCNRVLS